MAEVTKRIATELDVLTLSPHIRDTDRLELLASTGETPDQALFRGLYGADICYSFQHRERVVAMAGVTPSPVLDMGIVWFLGSDAVSRLPKAMLSFGRELVTEFHSLYPTLFNFIDARHRQNARWLERLGFFIVGTDQQHGVGRLPFHLMMRIDSVCAAQT